ncbi:MAG: peptidase P60, partial [Bosea sp. (in: a-proteobacteria)]
MARAATPDAIIDAARDWIGTPYLHQASLKGVGCDCLGLVRGVWRDVLGDEPQDVPPYAADWAEASGRETLAEAALCHLQPVALEDAGAGDVLLFRWRAHVPAKHCAILTGNFSARGSTII